MARTSGTSSASRRSGSHETVASSSVDEKIHLNERGESPKRSAFLWLALFVLILNGSWGVHHYQYETLPVPLSSDQAGKRGFSEHEAMEHVKALTELGPHPVGSDALDLALQYVLEAAEKITKVAHWEVDVQVDFFHANSGANRLANGLFKGRTLVYSDLKHVVVRILPKYLPEAEGNAILVSSHIDTVFSTEGAGDCSSCVAVMLELARGVSQWANGFKNAVIFLFNTGEEEGLNGAHSFITQHPWSTTVRLAVDLEAMGIGGLSSIFQSGPDPWAIENFAMVAKYPSGQILAQDLYLSGFIKSATDFQVYKEVAGLSGLDFAYSDSSAVYHTKNDKLKLLKPGSLQHLGENMLAFLLQTATSSRFLSDKAIETSEVISQDQAIYFDIMGTYMIVYRQRLASMLQNSVIIQALLIWITSLLMGGYPAAASLGLSFISIIIMWIFSLSSSVLVAFLLPLICSSPLPYIASPWLVIGLFGAPAFIGALTGQHVGYLILQKYLWHAFSKREQKQSPAIQAELIKLEAERWLFKAGSVQWLLILMVGNFYKIGSSYIAVIWLASPAFAYGFLEATLSPVRSPKPLKIVTLLLGITVPIIITAGIFIRLVGTITGIMVLFDRSPGTTPEWLGNVMVAVFVAAIICLTSVYLLSYVHLSDAKRSIFLAMCALFGLTLSLVVSGIVPPFTEDVARAVNVVHVVETTGQYGGNQTPISYISLFSTTPGKLMKEVEHVKEEGFICGKEKVIDFVTFRVEYGCWSSDETLSGWSKADIPTMHVESDVKGDGRSTQILIDTKVSTRWSLAINTLKIADFKVQDELIPVGNKNGIDGWHIIQFSGGKNAPTKFNLTLFWVKNYAELTHKPDAQRRDQHLLLKLRTDVDRLTPKSERVLTKLPPWCSQFGKSTSPNTLAFLSSLPVDF
ncbi:endoplasmic reticulum metallopeptidase 1 isoform X2 [Macadamia integrifolia]|uniref:endoplasmic reticulum metallopeptidase 1 isoform X2 n=1 Tax=Macadamia integrifolia TaxID=60698 RepID=UPI001C4EA486|nr:endoplasmic reticulum metallopeptidase 1 isoform X2 [Macadamia integrifolia]